MSKFKPEVSDVWAVDFAKYIVLHTKDDVAQCLVSDFRTAEFSISFLQQFCVYLGKSKGNVEELFDVRRENDA